MTRSMTAFHFHADQPFTLQHSKGTTTHRAGNYIAVPANGGFWSISRADGGWQIVQADVAHVGIQFHPTGQFVFLE